MSSEPFRTIVRKARKAAKLTGTEFARRIGRSQSGYSLWECGHRQAMPRETAIKIARVLELDEDECVVAAGHLPADVEQQLWAEPKSICNLIRLGPRASEV